MQQAGIDLTEVARQGFAPDYPGRPIVKNGKYTSNVIGNLKAGAASTQVDREFHALREVAACI